jgi:hypothetical protein
LIRRRRILYVRGMKFSRPLAVALVAATGALAQSTQFAEGDFVGWTQQTILYDANPPAPLTPGSAANATLGAVGSPGDGWTMHHVVTTNTALINVVLAPTAAWHPALQGALVGVFMQLDASTLSSPFCCAAQGVGVACEQGGTVYIAGNSVAGMAAAWHPITPVSAVATDFTPPGGSPTAHPDFAGGGPVRFGFYCSNGTCLNCGGYQTTVRYDNWSLALTAAAVYPGTGSDFRMRTSVSASAADDVGVKTAAVGAFLTTVLDSPLGAYVGAPLVLAADLRPTGAPAPGAAPVWLDFGTLFVLADGLAVTPLGYAHTVSPLGSAYGAVVPPGLSGFSVYVQAAAFAAPGVALSAAYEIRVL